MMRKVSVVVLLASVLLATVVSTAGAVPPAQRNFRAHLSGDQEVGSVETLAQGQATFQLNRAGDELGFKLIVANIVDVFAAHIHCAPSGSNGPVGVTLFSGSTVSPNGELSSGIITSPNPGNACGWATLNDVLAAMRAGDTYVNVHTNANPGGEIRGQIH